MALKDLKIPTQAIDLSIGGDPLVVRGLTFVDITAIYRDHGAELSAIFSRFVAEGKNLTEEVTRQVLRELVTAAPEAVASCIACAADEPGETEQAIRLPMVDQALLLEAIFKLTFASEAQIKKLAETAVRALNGVNGLAITMTDR